ncbi:DUF883 domain-containing protein [Glaciecola sp. 2405UD65-10]|uniref:DUF883 domain-containing protein n=1 Tax=Glaciecola sp. 2405UD65-10 TaxID=3397244 RepID=UPI003B5BCFAE
MAQAKATTNTTNTKTANSEHPVIDKVRDTLHESVDTLAQKAASTEESLRSGAQNGTQSIQEAQAKAQAKWEESGVKKYATENPIATAGIAFAAGMLFSAVLRRK